MWARHMVILPIRAYRYLISPALGHNCRYYPSCSAFACEAIGIHGIAKGLWLSVRRILRCNPWSEGGFDPVPPASSFYSIQETSRSHGK
jgi:putative membrane protein insertion efficiency factor